MEVEKQDIKMSTASKERKTLWYLQKMKDKGEMIVQMCPAELGPVFALKTYAEVKVVFSGEFLRGAGKI